VKISLTLGYVKARLTLANYIVMICLYFKTGRYPAEKTKQNI
jgi:hypothetical protein